MPKLKLSPLLVIILIILSGIGGYNLGINRSLGQPAGPEGSLKATVTSPQNNSIYSNQTADALGKVINVDSGTIAVIPDNSQLVTQFSLAKDYSIYIPEKTPTTIISAKPEQIIKNREALINLTLVDNTYQVKQIAYFPLNASGSAQRK